MKAFHKPGAHLSVEGSYETIQVTAMGAGAQGHEKGLASSMNKGPKLYVRVLGFIFFLHSKRKAGEKTCHVRWSESPPFLYFQLLLHISALVFRGEHIFQTFYHVCSVRVLSPHSHRERERQWPTARGSGWGGNPFTTLLSSAGTFSIARLGQQRVDLESGLSCLSGGAPATAHRQALGPAQFFVCCKQQCVDCWNRSRLEGFSVERHGTQCALAGPGSASPASYLQGSVSAMFLLDPLPPLKPLRTRQPLSMT